MSFSCTLSRYRWASYMNLHSAAGRASQVNAALAFSEGHWVQILFWYDLRWDTCYTLSLSTHCFKLCLSKKRVILFHYSMIPENDQKALWFLPCDTFITIYLDNLMSLKRVPITLYLWTSWLPKISIVSDWKVRILKFSLLKYNNSNAVIRVQLKPSS